MPLVRIAWPRVEPCTRRRHIGLRKKIVGDVVVVEDHVRRHVGQHSLHLAQPEQEVAVHPMAVTRVTAPPSSAASDASFAASSAAWPWSPCRRRGARGCAPGSRDRERRSARAPRGVSSQRSCGADRVADPHHLGARDQLAPARRGSRPCRWSGGELAERDQVVRAVDAGELGVALRQVEPLADREVLAAGRQVARGGGLLARSRACRQRSGRPDRAAAPPAAAAPGPP